MIEISDYSFNTIYLQMFFTIAKIILIIHSYQFKLKLDKLLHSYSIIQVE
jgi:hypothetical protein